uniref:Carrier domain-containing protein n=1 Tax=Kwoniella dejecticola CBS 10117 TaxID=1296121 RepID=A0A1A6A683_9TREE|nr:uncharacterized protein I303_04907 [Kwoniella dejecticola CBS 10117]OBR85571.1 hypothetical protein I303_04907 [Kwoniella dejecticola CBS 10117]
MPLSYLVSTAGHAQHQNEEFPHDIQNILQLIANGAEEFGQEKVVGFTSRSDDAGWTCDRYSFPELLDLSSRLANGLASNGVGDNKPDARIVSLLCPTGLDFLLAWIALMRLGYGVVLIAPQCSPSAIAHLYNSSSSSRLIFHPKYAELAETAHQLNDKISTVVLPDVSEHPPLPALGCTVKDVDSISHVFHTSGTSGTPKPIPNTHSRSVSVLPRRALPSYIAPSPQTSRTPVPSGSAAFTTTPLFHGGISDLLRAWMARSMIYFYPTSDVAITSDNIVQALSEAQAEERKHRFKVTSFLSVPYILSTLVEDETGPGVEMLRQMDYVSTGGAPLDTNIGDMMVGKGIRLVSRLGSSECGFLLSSHRDYAVEKDWEWLRNDSPYCDALVFEPVDKDSSPDGARYEMVVTDRWLSKTKSNRDDGSYATGDLYQPHPTKKNVWRYVGRGDDVIVLSNGEKASPGPIETILRSSQLLADALVVGSDQSQLGVLLFPREIPFPTNMMQDLAPLIDQSNVQSPSFAQITKDMCFIVNNPAKLLPKSSKGTIQRGVAYEVFKEEIDQLYKEQGRGDAGSRKRSLQEIQLEVERHIKDAVASRLKLDKLGPDVDLFSWGVDSLMATRIRTSLQKHLNTGGTILPNNVVFEKPSINRLSQYIYDLQERNSANGDQADNLHKLMEDLLVRYGNFDDSGQDGFTHSDVAQAGGATILLTGATGSLGSFLVHQLAQLPSTLLNKVICLVRAEGDEQARIRVQGELTKRGLQLQADSRLEVLAAELVDPNLGLTLEVFHDLARTVDVVVHAAWPVHFTSTLVSFEDSIRGARNLLDLVAKTARGKMFYCSSLASVLGKPSPRYFEEPSDDPATASPIGYSQSKWVTEKICRLAAESDTLRNRVHILRVGQLCGDTHGGHWNEKEGWPLLIRTAQTTGSLPLLQERPSWLPVDLASQAIESVSPLIYHIVHPLNIEWSTVLDALKAAGLSFKRLETVEWLRRVEASTDDLEENPSKQMLDLWKTAYGESAKIPSDVVVDVTNASASSPTIRNLSPIDNSQIIRMVNAWRRTGFLQS